MAFVIPQHLPRAARGENLGFGSTTSHAEPVLKKLATRSSITATDASEWIEELQKSIDDTKDRVHQCIHRDLPTFERQLASAKQIQNGLEELTLSAEGLTARVEHPQAGLLPTILSTLSTHSALAQRSSDAQVLHAALVYLARCRAEFNALATLVKDGQLPTAVRKAGETQSLIQSAPRPLEQSSVMKDISRMARVLGDRVQGQLEGAYSRAIAVTTFPTGTTIVVSPQVTIEGSSGIVTLSELFASLESASLQERLSTLRKDILVRAIEPILTKPSRLVASIQESTLTVDHASSSESDPKTSKHVHEALDNTVSLARFLHGTLLPAIPLQNTFGAQLAGPLAQAIVKHILRPSIPRSGALADVPEFLRIAKHAGDIEEVLFKLGLRSEDVREWTQSAATHYERLRREDLVQNLRRVVLEHEGGAVSITRERVIEKDEPTNDEEDPWAFEESVPAPSTVPIIATPTPKSPPPPPAAPYVVGSLTEPSEPPPQEAEEDGWGFDDEEPGAIEPAEGSNGGAHKSSSQPETSEDEPDVEVYATTSQSEGAGAESRSEGTSHLAELLSAPQSDVEVVNPQSSEESDAWDDDPWADQEEDSKPASEAPAPSKPLLPTLSPAKAPEPAKPIPPKPTSPVKPLAVPALVETPASPVVKSPAPRVARGLERFAQKSRGSPSPTPSKFSSPIVSNSSPTASFAPSSAFGTAPSSAFPTSAASTSSSHASPSKLNTRLPNPQMSPPKRFATPPAPFVPPEPPKIAPPLTPAMRRAQQGKVANPRPSSPLATDSRRRNGLQRDDQSAVESVSGLFGNGSASRAGSEVGYGSQVGSQLGYGSQAGYGSQVGVGSQVGTGSQVGITSPDRKDGIPSEKKAATETYMVSRKAQKVFGLAENALKEGRALVSSNIFPSNTSPAPGTLVLGCIPSFFDLFRALVPVAHAGPMAASAGIAMRFSNDCIYLSEEILRIIADLPKGPVGDAVRPKLQEARSMLKLLGENWFEEVQENEKLAISKFLEPAEGFKDLQDQARNQECRRAVTRCTQAIMKFSRDTKPVLSSTKYYLVLGALVENLLTHLIDDILVMHDIPETESHRLHDICKIIHALETLFTTDMDETSVITQYVSSWFKFSYLSEILEASLADIRHLFDMGALIDFSEQDLVHLVRALFSDSPKRQELIDRVLAGHPTQA